MIDLKISSVDDLIIKGNDFVTVKARDYYLQLLEKEFRTFAGTLFYAPTFGLDSLKPGELFQEHLIRNEIEQKLDLKPWIVHYDYDLNYDPYEQILRLFLKVKTIAGPGIIEVALVWSI